MPLRGKYSVFSLFRWGKGLKSPLTCFNSTLPTIIYVCPSSSSSCLLANSLPICLLLFMRMLPYQFFLLFFSFWYHAHQPTAPLFSLQPHSFVFVRPTISKIIQKALGRVLWCLRRVELSSVSLSVFLFPKTQTWRKRFRFKSHYISEK